MNRNSFKKWLDILSKAWITRNPKLAADICANNVLYYETPFNKPLKSKKEVEEIWKDVPKSQEDIKFSYDIISVNQELGIAQWRASFTRLPSRKKDVLDGIFIVKLDHHGLCREFHQWWVVKTK